MEQPKKSRARKWDTLSGKKATEEGTLLCESPEGLKIERCHTCRQEKEKMYLAVCTHGLYSCWACSRSGRGDCAEDV